VVNPGSVVSLPRVDSSRTFAMVDLDNFEVTFHDVESGDSVEAESWE
jgi:predicted phosphodiesterase